MILTMFGNAYEVAETLPWAISSRRRCLMISKSTWL